MFDYAYAVSEADEVAGEPALCPCGQGYVGHEPGSWLEPCAECDEPAHCDDGAPDRSAPLCHRAECRDERRAYITSRPVKCPRCDMPGVIHPDTAIGEPCGCCGAAATVDWRSHYHPYRSTND